MRKDNYVMTNRDDGGVCGAVWYHGDGKDRTKHVSHRAPRHQDRHHSDEGLWWSRDPHARRVRLDLDTPCGDCKPTQHDDRHEPIRSARR